ncbi:hypothetical protein HKX48_000098 [Thoreauomyces humboldtii]|nr:hypothetical protein HKX48_000098 [Thoreauomyces humboldtii]
MRPPRHTKQIALATFLTFSLATAAPIYPKSGGLAGSTDLLASSSTLGSSASLSVPVEPRILHRREEIVDGVVLVFTTVEQTPDMPDISVTDDSGSSYARRV